ncbi:MAG: universal stress protein [Gammaproteobacteria bacterium]
MSYKRIMVAVDGSETSDLALNEAIQLTKALHSKLCIIHL